MQIKTGWKNFLQEVVATKKPIVCFGAGAVSTFIENLLIENNIWSRILYFLDNNPSKEGKTVGDLIKIPIITVDSFKKKRIDDFILLITIESYVVVENQFNQFEQWNHVSCYEYIKLNYEIQKELKQSMWLLPKGKPAIVPKIIHYCWFGKSEKNELHKYCIESWKRHCPDYEMVEWNEDNYDVKKTLYMRQAYEAGKWAYVSDYARLDILYRYGGIYIDTDVELFCNFDELLGTAFIAHGQWPAVNSGSGMGTEKGNEIILEMLEDERAVMPFIQKDGTYNMMENGYYESKVLRRHGYNEPFAMKSTDGMLILAPEILATSSVLGEKIFVTENTVSLHHCAGSWASLKALNERKETVCRHIE